MVGDLFWSRLPVDQNSAINDWFSVSIDMERHFYRESIRQSCSIEAMQGETYHHKREGIDLLVVVMMVLKKYAA